MTIVYTNFTSVFSDAQLYAVIFQGGDYTLDIFDAIAQNRWTWLVENWTSLYQRFNTSAAGDQSLLQTLGKMQREVDSYRLGNTNNPLKNTTKFSDFVLFLSQISLSELVLSDEEIKSRDERIKLVSELTEEDFRGMISFLQKTSAIMIQDLGLSDPTAEALYGLTARPRRRTPTIQDLDKLTQIDQVANIIKGYIYNLQVTQKRPPNLLNSAKTNQDGDNVDILDIYKTYSPVPFEISLESMAKKYLGGVDRWYELVTVNNLQPPYIDELGTKFSLQAPGAGSTLIISAAQKDYVAPGTKIRVGSNKVREETRVVERVSVSENDVMVLFVSGEQNLSRFKPTEGGFVRIFKPATVRKNSFILIPSTISATSGSAKPTPSRDDLRRMEKAFIDFGIDIKRDEKTRDLVFSPTGDFLLATGFVAVKQAVSSALKTRIGELTFHPGFGINSNIGQQFFNTLDESFAFAEIIQASLLRDPRFQSVKIAKLESLDGGFAMQLLVTIKGFDQPIPLSFVS